MRILFIGQQEAFKGEVGGFVLGRRTQHPFRRLLALLAQSVIQDTVDGLFINQFFFDNQGN